MYSKTPTSGIYRGSVLFIVVDCLHRNELYRRVAHTTALGYAANDIVLIIMWIMATVDDPSYLPMIVCFSVFFINDCYGFVNWRKIRQRQGETVPTQ